MDWSADGTQADQEIHRVGARVFYWQETSVESPSSLIDAQGDQKVFFLSVHVVRTGLGSR